MVGDTLRKERERQKLSIKDIEKGTSIRALYIEAIEKGDYQTLPGEVYAKGFVRNYANFLKIDADACVRQYQDDISLSMSVPEESVSAQEREKKHTSSFSTGNDYHERIERPHQQQNFVLIALMLGVILIGGWLAFGNSLTGPESSNRVAEKHASADAKKPAVAEQPSVAQTPATQSPAAPSATPAPATQPAAPATVPATASKDDIDLHAQFTDRCWMQVIADGQVVFEGTAEKGDAMSWKAKNTIVITAGNAGAVDITQNGKLLGNPGDYGAVVEKTYTKNMQ